jgi:mRNA-degrading endonuclease RelE of RelBE toxin-antitoxin system
LVVIREVVWTKKFERELRKLKDGAMKNRVKEQIKKIVEDPETGKSLRFALRGERSMYVSPYRLIYAVQGETSYLLKFEHRKTVYRSL